MFQRCILIISILLFSCESPCFLQLRNIYAKEENQEVPFVPCTYPFDLILSTIYPCILHVCKDKREHLERISLVCYSTVIAGAHNTSRALLAWFLLHTSLFTGEIQNLWEDLSFRPAVQLHLAHVGLNLLKINILKSSNFRAFKRYLVSVKYRGTR